MNVELESENGEENEEITIEKTQLKPSPLKAGSKVGLICPASRPDSPRSFKRCMQIIEDMGFVPVAGKNVLRYDGFTAGTDEERIDDLHTFIEDDSIGAILSVCGGYGALRLLPLLDFAQVRQHPKIFLGSGDNDALLLAINELTGLVVFHAQNLEEIDDNHTYTAVKSLLYGKNLENQIRCRDEEDASFAAAAYPLSEELVEGIICGGNLSSLCTLFGTKYQPQLKDKILALDDFTERNSILDRWFTTLYLSGVLFEVAGIAFGDFPACGGRGADNMLSIEDTFGDRIKELRLPACFGFKFGRANKDNVLPIGIQAKLDCGQGILEFLESPLNNN
jgi:muramoyltetrapeptide carboxypeptidase